MEPTIHGSERFPVARRAADSEPEDGFDAVLAAAREGQHWALATLYRETQPALLRYLRGHAPGEEEDLAADVWMAVARSITTFVGDRNGFRRLVFTIARRRGIDSARQRGRRRTDPASLAGLAEHPGPDNTEMRALDRMTGDAAITRIMALLPPEQAEVVLLRVVAGLGVAEVAELTGRRPAAVSVLQHRALRRLARHFGTGEQP
jgi:RNA polymerase sigma-70 factor (ECF subfamily)